MPSPPDNRKHTTMPTFPRGGWVVFAHLAGYECLSSFREVGYKLLLVMIRKETKQGRLDSRIPFLKKKGGYGKVRMKGKIIESTLK